jgi:hypothetical protein
MPGFPENVVDVLHGRFDTLMDDFEVIRRPLRILDPSRSIGLFVYTWAPVQDSTQIGQEEPTLNRYEYRIQLLVKATREIDARTIFGSATKSVRAILYRDAEMSNDLLSLTEDLLGTRETLKRFGVTRQTFANNDLGKRGFAFLTTTELWVQSEVIKL